MQKEGQGVYSLPFGRFASASILRLSRSVGTLHFWFARKLLTSFCRSLIRRDSLEGVP